MNVFLKVDTTFLLIILFSSFYLIISNNISFNEKSTYSINIPSESGNKYGELLLEGNLNSTYVLSVYSEESKKKRIQLGQSFKGKIQLYISLKDFNKNIYIEIECPKDNDCTGNVSYFFIDKIKLIEGQPITYYVNRDDEEIEFSLSLNSEKTNIWARGQYDIQTTFEESNFAKKIQNCGHFYLIEGRKEEISFIVKPTKGDYINVGYIGYNKNFNYDSYKNIEVDGPVLTGYLKKGFLDEICYSLNKEDILENELVLGNGIIYTKIGYSYVAYKNGNKYPNSSLYTSGFIKNWLFFHKDNNEDLKICITFPDSTEFPNFTKIEEIVYVYQLEKANKKDISFYEPQLNGVLYSRNIQKGAKAAFISQNNGNFKTMSLNLMSLVGFPKMYIIQCQNFPLCNYDDTTLNKSIIPKNINRWISFNINKEEGFDDSPINKKQTLFVVECLKSQNRIDNVNLPEYLDYICDYNTLIYKDNDYIELIEDKIFNQFILEDQVHNYKIKIAGESGIKKIFIDIMIYVGEADVNISDFKNKELNTDLYYQINKRFISVKINGNSEDVEDLFLFVKGINNAYYTILMTFANEDNEVDSFFNHKLQTGMSYLVAINTSQFIETQDITKNIKFKNERIYDSIPFMINLNSLYCDIDVTNHDGKNNKIMEKFEQSSQDIVESKEDRYLSSEYEYIINVKSREPSKHNSNLCLIYASTIELTEDYEEYYSRDILIPDNTPQQIRFGNNVRHISFGYIHVNLKNNLLVKFNLKHIAQYKIKFYYDNYERDKGEETIVSNNITILKSEEWSSKACGNKTRICYITLDITLERTKEDNDKPVLELLIKSLDIHSVNYIPKNQLIIDYIPNNEPQYYYTDIGLEDYGFITLNFLRGNGKIYARLVETNLEENGFWRGKYSLPIPEKENEMDILVIDSDEFTKEINYVTFNECNNGCYLLLSLYPDIQDNGVIFDRYYSYSLIVHSLFSQDAPIVKIPVNEYIIGSVGNEGFDNLMYYYSVWLNYDADRIIIDFQSDSAGIYINIGDQKPTTESYNFNFWSSGNNIIYNIEKNDIMNYLDETQEEKGLKDIILTIGIWTDKKASVFISLFALCVRLEDNKEKEIYRVNSDQKVLCNPKKYNDKYRCVYLLDHNFAQNDSLIFIYANAQDKSSVIYIYADFIDEIKYEMSSRSDLNNIIPNKGNNPKYSTENINLDYLSIKINSTFNEYLIVSVESSKESIIEFLSTLLNNQEEIIPNPSIPKLYSILPGHKYYFNFPYIYKIVFNIICLGGEGEINWIGDDNKYKLNGKDDVLSITSRPSIQSHFLYITGIGDSYFDKAFVFIAYYNIRNDNNRNFDILNLEQPVNYVYIDIKFPINFYTQLFTEKINGDDEYYEITFNFDLLESTKEKELAYYKIHPFTIQGFIVGEDLFYNIKEIGSSFSIDDNTIYGIYDQALRTGLIRITHEVIQQSINHYYKPYLNLELDLDKTYKTIRGYKKVLLETSVSYINSDIPISEESNKFGLLDSNQDVAKYILKNNKKYKLLFLEFSCIDESLSINIIDYGSLNNKETKFGKIIYYIQTSELKDLINLSVKRNNDQENDSIQYFLIRYTFHNKINKKKYSIKDTKFTVQQYKFDQYTNFTIKLYPLEINSKPNEYNITYIIRLNKDNMLKPKKACIVLKPNEHSIKEYYDPKLKKGEELLTFEVFKVDNSKEIKYIEVIVQIKKGEKIEYLSYDLNDAFELQEKNNVILIILIILSSLIFIIILTLIIIIIIYKRKNKNLLEEVERTSFIDNDKKNDKKKDEDEDEDEDERDNNFILI